MLVLTTHSVLKTFFQNMDKLNIDSAEALHSKLSQLSKNEHDDDEETNSYRIKKRSRSSRRKKHKKNKEKDIAEI